MTKLLSIPLLIALGVAQTQSTFETINKCCGLARTDFQRINSGDAIGRVLKTGERDIALLGAVRIPGNKEQFLNYYRNLQNLQNKANKLARRMLLDYVKAYQSKGSAALGKLNDKEAPLELSGVFRTLATHFSFLGLQYPKLFQKLTVIQGVATGPDEFLYWSREEYGFGLKPLRNVIHVSIHRPEPTVILICSRQLRSNHYYDGFIGITLVADAPAGGSYLLYINRSRIDLISEGGWLQRLMVERNIPSSTRKEMLAIRNRVERSYSSNAIATNLGHN